MSISLFIERKKVLKFHKIYLMDLKIKINMKQMSLTETVLSGKNDS